ncbi:MAG: carbamoyl-phosphate synthase small subunit, partial [Rhodothermales bacterium]
AYDFASSEGHRIAVVDYGVKQNILRSFRHRGCAVRVFPAGTALETILSWNPDGLFFSNGPGDPRAMPDQIDLVKAAAKTGLPMFGICLGHQLMALSQGLDVYKMYVGHRGANHPVQNLETKRVEVTTQNHGFAVSSESLTDGVARMTHINLNDRTLEGLAYQKVNGSSVQYHPEASPGPHDSDYLFDQFVERVGAHSGSAVRSPKSAE